MSSTSVKLLELILDLKMMELECGMKVHFVHVHGIVMILQGTNGLSRGNILEGLIVGQEMISVVPLHIGTIASQKELLGWIKSWCLDNGIGLFLPIDWFERGHDILGYTINVDSITTPRLKTSTFISAPHPEVANVSVEELRKVRHKRQYSLHMLCLSKKN